MPMQQSGTKNRDVTRIIDFMGSSLGSVLKIDRRLFACFVRGMFFNSWHLLDYFSRGLTARKLFVCSESPIFSDQIGIKIVAV